MIYVLSDIHGNERRFNSILEQINLCGEDTLYVLGDVVDRHPMGIRILHKIIKMPNVKMLLGNHEYMMLRALGCPYDVNDSMSEFDLYYAQMLWYRNGGMVTHQHWKRIQKEMRKEIVDYLRGLPLNIDIEVNRQPYKLVHGAPIEDYTDLYNYEKVMQYALWGRLNKKDLEDRDYTLIFGHTPTEYYQDCFPMQIWQYSQGIGIDCGSGYAESTIYRNSGRLACLRLDDGMVFYSDEIT